MQDTSVAGDLIKLLYDTIRSMTAEKADKLLAEEFEKCNKGTD